MNSNDPQAQLGPCEYITQVFTKEDGSYSIDDSTPMRFFPTTNEKRYLNLKPTTDGILARRPFRFFMHPKDLDSILAGYIQSGKAHLLREENAVVTYRGILTKIFLGDSVNLHVSCIAGKLFMEQEDPNPEWVPPTYDFGDAIGMAFEDAYTSAGTGDHSHVDHQWSNIIARNLGDLRLIMCGEVDAVKHTPGTVETKNDWYNRRIELKTKSCFHKAPVNLSFRKWHMQSTLLGVPEIFVGWRDKSHKVVRTEMLQTSDIKPFDYEHNIGLGHFILSILLRFLNGEIAKGESEDTIWRVTIHQWVLYNWTKLDETAAGRVKRRRDPTTERVGIVPKDMVPYLRAQ